MEISSVMFSVLSKNGSYQRFREIHSENAH